MNSSIHQEIENCIHFLEESYTHFLKTPNQFAEFLQEIEKNMLQLGLLFLKNTLQECDELLRNSGKRKQNWQIVRRDPRTLLTSLGSVTYVRTLFKNKQEGKCSYLLDQLLGLTAHERLTEDALTRMLLEAAHAPYWKAGEAACFLDTLSRQTVGNHLHDLDFPPEEVAEEKRKVEVLYIDADEDHVALQYQKTKGDLVENEQHQKNNGLYAKLIYVYEGKEPMAPKGERKRLIHPHYFGGVYEGAKENERLWDEVYKYIEQTYDQRELKKIYLNGDGGGWIKAGAKRMADVTYVLDEFHLEKYKRRAIPRADEKQEERWEELERTLLEGDKRGMMRLLKEVESEQEKESTKKRIRGSMEYLKNNWAGIQARKQGEEIEGCSAEGHISHVLSARMSSRPMGWCRKGAGAMAKLRIYVKNGRDLLELVRYQKKKGKKEEVEKEVLSFEAIRSSEGETRGMLGKYFEILQARTSLLAKKQVYFQSQIWGL